MIGTNENAFVFSILRWQGLPANKEQGGKCDLYQLQSTLAELPESVPSTHTTKAHTFSN